MEHAFTITRENFVGEGTEPIGDRVFMRMRTKCHLSQAHNTCELVRKIVLGMGLDVEVRLSEQGWLSDLSVSYPVSER